MPYPPEQQKIVDKIGPSWCFAHSEARPCAECAGMPPFMGLCFDCKREVAGKDEGGIENCSCGSRVRRKRLYRGIDE